MHMSPGASAGAFVMVSLVAALTSAQTVDGVGDPATQGTSCAVRAYAHRGTFAGAVHTENTVPAFWEVVAAGGHGLETDLRVTKDGAFVFMHDPTVDRTTTGTGAVADMTLKQIERIRTDDGGQIPTLRDGLDAVRPYDVSMLIEVKPTDLWNRHTLRRMTHVIHKADMSNRVLLYAGGLSQVQLVRAHTHLLVLWKHIGRVDVDWLAKRADGLTAKPATRRFVRRLHEAGLVVVARREGHHPRFWWRNLNSRKKDARPEGVLTGHIDRYADWCR
jgi:glycerophosphoryl diester phosphodiesterase